jgi:beta-xylosidase
MPHNRRQFLKLPAPWLLANGAGAAITPRPTKAIPLLLGNWADPSILKDGSDYYMTHSSFEHQPGSRDSRSWKPVSRAVVNQKGSIWAPEIIRHNGRYYIYYPAVDSGSATTGW